MLIVISGKARCGKDLSTKFITDILKNTYDIDFSNRAYADALKKRLMDDFGLSHDQLYGNTKEIPDTSMPKGNCTFWTPRELLQFIGTDVYRNIDPDFWVTQLQNYIRKVNCNIIITDARFPNEINWVLEQGGIHIMITRDSSPDIADSTHASENALDDFDTLNTSNYELCNNGTKYDLYNNIKDVIIPIILNKLNEVT